MKHLHFYLLVATSLVSCALAFAPNAASAADAAEDMSEALPLTRKSLLLCIE
jgi:hypothetical protein